MEFKGRHRFCMAIVGHAGPRSDTCPAQPPAYAHSAGARGPAQGAKTCPTGACFESESTGRV